MVAKFLVDLSKAFFVEELLKCSASSWRPVLRRVDACCFTSVTINFVVSMFCLGDGRVFVFGLFLGDATLY